MKRSKLLLKAIKKALKNEFLYDDKEIIYMKEQIRILEEEISAARSQRNKGFGQ
tara:strand:- start:197 stop:358 length:162 start_codon:yes stop_codon:yes gene_type:complete